MSSDPTGARRPPRRLAEYSLLPARWLGAPERAKLYSPEPVGIGTAFVESLTSFITRLAAAHAVTPQALFSLFAPVLGTRRASESPSAILGNCESSPGARLDGTGDSVERIVDTLLRLTLRDDLRLLTMVPWRKALAPQSLLRLERAWCGACYDAQRRKGFPLAAPLLWSLAVVTACPVHRLHLEDRCPWCGRTSIGLHSAASPGQCPWCLGWLGRMRTAQEKARGRSDAELRMACRRATLVGDLLVAPEDLANRADARHFSATIDALVEQCAGGSRHGLARGLGRRCGTIQHWHNGTRAPRLESVTAICLELELSPVDVLTKRTRASDEMAVRMVARCRSRREPRRTRVATPAELESMKTELVRIARAKESPPSLGCVAERLGHSPAYFLRNFPVEWERITLRRAYEHGQRGRGAAKERARAWAGLLENLLEREPPVSVEEAARQCGVHKQTLYDRHGALMRRIAARHVAYRRRLIRERILPVLEAALEEEPPPPMAEVSRRLAELLGCRQTTRASNHFPELCRRIVERFAAARRLATKERHEAIEREIRSVIESLERQGREPSHNNVLAGLSKDTGNTYLLCRLVIQVRRELGLYRPSVAG